MNQAEIRRRQIQAIVNIFALITVAVIARVTGYEGVTYVAVGGQVYAFVFTIVSGGVSDALGRLLRIRNNKGQYKNAKIIRRYSMLLQLVSGAVGTILIFVFTDEVVGNVFQMQYSALILKILAPAVFLRSVSAVLQGYTGGAGSELPMAVAGVLRQIFILGFSLTFCRMLGKYGEKVSHLLVQDNFTFMYSGVGVALAVTLAEVFVIIFLAIVSKISNGSANKASKDMVRSNVSLWDSVRMLWGSRLTQAGMQLLAMLFLPIGFIFLQKAVGNDEIAAVYGAYLSGYGVTCGILIAFVMIFVLPLCGKTLGLLRREEHRFARLTFQSGVHILVVHTAFFAVLLGVVSEQTAAVVSLGQADTVTKMFQAGSSVVLMIALSLYFARTLILLGKKYLVFVALALMDVVYMVAVTVLLNTGKAGILALVYGGMFGSAVLCIVLGALTYRQLRVRVDWIQILVVPLVMACVAGIGGVFLSKIFTPHLGNAVTLLVCLVLCGGLYWAGLLLLRNFREQELEVIPGGRLINALGQMLHVL